jgi:hypothetical protein
MEATFLARPGARLGFDAEKMQTLQENKFDFCIFHISNWPFPFLRQSKLFLLPFLGTHLLPHLPHRNVIIVTIREEGVAKGGSFPNPIARLSFNCRLSSAAAGRPSAMLPAKVIVNYSLT